MEKSKCDKTQSICDAFMQDRKTKVYAYRTKDVVLITTNKEMYADMLDHEKQINTQDFDNRIYEFKELHGSKLKTMPVTDEFNSAIMFEQGYTAGPLKKDNEKTIILTSDPTKLTDYIPTAVESHCDQYGINLTGANSNRWSWTHTVELDVSAVVENEPCILGDQEHPSCCIHDRAGFRQSPGIIEEIIDNQVALITSPEQ